MKIQPCKIQDAAKAELTWKSIAIQAFLKKKTRKISNKQPNLPTYHLKELEKEEQIKPKFSRRKEIIREEINKIQRLKKKKNRKKINKTKSWFLETINKINKSLARLTRKARERIKIKKVRNKKEENSINTEEIQNILREYYEQLYANKSDNLEEMDNFQETYSSPKLNQKKQII